MFEDPQELEALAICEDSVSDTPCVKNSNTEFPIDSDLLNALYKLTLDMVGVSYQFPEDNLGNARASNTGQDIE